MCSSDLIDRNKADAAVNENFDTAAPEDAHSGIIIPLRNMIKDVYKRQHNNFG